MTIEELRKIFSTQEQSPVATLGREILRASICDTLCLPLLAVAEAAEKETQRCNRCGGFGTVAMIGYETGPCPVCGPLRTALREFDNAREGV